MPQEAKNWAVEAECRRLAEHLRDLERVAYDVEIFAGDAGGVRGEGAEVRAGGGLEV